MSKNSDQRSGMPSGNNEGKWQVKDKNGSSYRGDGNSSRPNASNAKTPNIHVEPENPWPRRK